MNLDYLYTAISWVLLRWHQLFTWMGLDSGGGVSWTLSIIFLVVTARLLLVRMFVKQVHYQRGMQAMQPKISKLKEKYKDDKAGLQREMMALQKEEGFNPVAGCLPMFLQIPVFISLFHVLKHLSNAVVSGYPDSKLALYGFTPKETLSAAHAKLFGAPLAASLQNSATKIHDTLGGDVSSTRVVTVVLIAVSALATFITQRAVIANATTPAEGTAATIQKVMVVGIPISVLFSGFIFPLGVLLYWFTSNIWTMGQQFYIHRFHPHVPAGSAASTGPVGEISRSLAPKPGAKPVNAKGSRGGTSTGAGTGSPGSTGTSVNGNVSGQSTARPANRGQKPTGGQKSTGARSGSKRPAPSKKRR